MESFQEEKEVNKMKKSIKMIGYCFIILIILWSSLLVTHSINSNELESRKKCQIDSDCIFYRIPPCESQIIINKKRTILYELERVLRIGNPFVFFDRGCSLLDLVPLEENFIPACIENTCRPQNTKLERSE